MTVTMLGAMCSATTSCAGDELGGMYATGSLPQVDGLRLEAAQQITTTVNKRPWTFIWNFSIRG